MMKLLRVTVALAAVHACASPLQAQSPWPADAPQAEVMLLGTFHFADQGLDSYRPRFDIDVRSPERQAEIESIVEQLAAFNPTRVAVERKPERQVQLDSLYRAYRAGEFELGPNEIYQIGFRLAARLGHERVWAIDAPARSFFPGMTQAQWDSAQAVRPAVDPTWDAHYMHWYAYEDSLKTTMPLADFLLYMNQPERLLRSHGAYLVGTFRSSAGPEDWWGVDAMSFWWNRNLRMFSNIMRLRQAPDERILVVVGVGHVPIIRHSIEAAPDVRLVEVGEYLRPAAGE